MARSNAKGTATTPDVGFHRTLRLANNNVSVVGRKVSLFFFRVCSFSLFWVRVIRTTTF